jgi:glycosyltransferase involved in cell wall biosynthesis
MRPAKIDRMELQRQARAKRPLRVVAVVANVKQYRAAFYSMLASSLAPFEIELTVIYSKPDRMEATKGDSIDLPPPLGRRVPSVSIANHRALLQLPRPRDILSADLIIIVQATGYLLNYPLLLLSAVGLKRIAYWGHGRNLQGNPNSIFERIKRMLANSTDWWFAYTNETKSYLQSIGVASQKITPIENAIDTRGFRKTLESINDQEIAAMRSALKIPAESPVGLYCGSLYREKRLDYLLSAAKLIADSTPGFRLLVVGAGPESDTIRRASESCDYVVYPGPAFDRVKAIYFRMADVFLNPGLAGLGILDSFAAGLPFITTGDAKHSPEIAYLTHGDNGLLINGDSRDFAVAVGLALRDPGLLRKMKRGAQLAAERYTIENMVENVKRGILQCLGVGHSAGIIGPEMR